ELEFILREERPASIITPKETTELSYYDIEEVNGLVHNVESYANHVLNVDYNTIDYSWAEKAISLLHIGLNDYGKELKLKQAKEYVDWVKDNKVVIEGKLKAEPSMIHDTFAGLQVRAYL